SHGSAPGCGRYPFVAPMSLERAIVQRQIGDHLLELQVFFLELTHPPQLADLHAALLGLPPLRAAIPAAHLTTDASHACPTSTHLRIPLIRSLLHRRVRMRSPPLLAGRCAHIAWRPSGEARHLAVSLISL